LLSQFNISKVNLKPGRVHVLGDVLSRAPHVMNETSLDINNAQASSAPVVRMDFAEHYDGDQFFGPIWRSFQGTMPEDPVQRERVARVQGLFRVEDGKLFYGRKVCVPRNKVRDFLFMAHDAKVAGHFGFAKTLSRLEAFHWKHKTRDVRQYCRGCQVCQQQKDHGQKKLTDPTPLDVPLRRWGSIGTDFIVGLPKTRNGVDAITTWVDRLSRRVRFIACKETDTAVDVAEAFFAHIFKLHGLPDSVVSDRDPKFTSKFWSRLMELCGISTQMSTSNHPQTDGASEVMNRMVENFLRCYCSMRQDDWDTLRPAAEFAYNSAVSEELGASPFEMDLGWKPQAPLDLFGKLDTPIEALNDFKSRMQSALEDSRYAHQVAKARQAAYSAQKYQVSSYKVGDKVWIDKSLFRDAIAKSQQSKKLSARRFGPFEVLKVVGKNAVQLDLPDNVKIHPVVHVANTRPFIAQPQDISVPVPPTPASVPEVGSGALLYKVDKLLKHRKRGRGYQFLTLLEGVPRHEAVWQPSRDFIDADGTLTEAFHKYIVEHGLLHHLH